MKAALHPDTASKKESEMKKKKKKATVAVDRKMEWKESLTKFCD